MTNETRMIPAGLLGDAGWRGALHILSAPLFERKGVWAFVDLKTCTFHYKRMLRRCRVFSSGEYLLLQVAASLFNEDAKVNLWDLVNRLDDTNLKLVLDAIAISRGWQGGSAKAGGRWLSADARDAGTHELDGFDQKYEDHEQ